MALAAVFQLLMKRHAGLDNHLGVAHTEYGAPGDWAGGEFWGPLASETRNWLDYVATGKPCALTNPQEARSNLEVTLAIEEAVETGETVRLAR